MASNESAAFITAKFQCMPDLSPQPCIYKVPNHLREVNEECYRPYFVSIGPLFYGNPSLTAMEDCKLRCLKHFLEHGSNSHRYDLKHYLRVVGELEGRIRDSYAESISLPSDEFNRMVLADSAFIILIFLTHHPTLSSSSMTFLLHMMKRSLLTWQCKLRRDLFLMENQIPFFVLEHLFQEAFGAAFPDTSLRDLALKYIKHVGAEINRHKFSNTIIEMIKNEEHINHLVDLVWKLGHPFFIREITRNPPSNANIKSLSNVSSLRACGVKFVASKSENLQDISFSKGVLQIPSIKLWDSSESFYRNVILFEQSHLPIYGCSYIVDYMLFLKKLIMTPEDVQVLVRCGVIENGIDSEDAVAQLFKDITRHIIIPANVRYDDVCRKLDAYATRRWNKWKAILKRDYFGHPWAAISVVFALALFILTLLQTIGTFTVK